MQARDFYQTEGAQSPDEYVIKLCLLSREAMTSLDDLALNVRQALVLQQFKGQLGHVAMMGDAEGRVKTVYIGQGEKTDVEALAHAVNRLPEGLYQPQQVLSMRACVMWSLAQYRFDCFKAKDETLCRKMQLTQEQFASVLPESSAIFLVRDLINTPANIMGPAMLTDVLKNLATEHSAQFEAWVGSDLLEAGFPAVHAVGRAAAEEPRLSILTWGDETHPRVTLVGKGVCFDSGGLDIKPSSGMRLMKKDMGGAAQVLGLAHWLMARRVPIRLQVLIPAVENAVGSQSYRPGDVLTMRNGMTVEIDNTDAEGRLVLADALVKACEDKPDVLFDFATLTGAARVAVGTEISAFFSNDEALASLLMDASKTTADPIWRMPLHKGYNGMLDSSIADCVNSSPSSYAGAIVAALFLERFMDANIPWAHFDLMAWNVSSKPGKPEGGEAMGMQTVAAYLMQRYT